MSAQSTTIHGHMFFSANFLDYSIFAKNKKFLYLMNFEKEKEIEKGELIDTDLGSRSVHCLYSCLCHTHFHTTVHTHLNATPHSIVIHFAPHLKVSIIGMLTHTRALLARSGSANRIHLL